MFMFADITNTHLHTHTHTFLLPFFQELILHQADIGAKDKNGVTPLHRAAYWYVCVGASYVS
jgi:ankyrin repeat protein